MKQKRILHRTFVCMFLVLGFSIAAYGQAAEKTATLSAYKELSVKDMQLKWKTDSMGLLHVILSAPTTGWVAVGFNPTKMMKNANIIIGYVKNGKAVVQDNFGSGLVKHQSDVELGGKDNVTLAEGTEAQGKTEIRFAIPLNSGDAKDCVLEAGKKCNVILAYGPDGKDELKTRHKKRYEAELEL